jgi:hypothetical protein
MSNNKTVDVMLDNKTDDIKTYRKEYYEKNKDKYQEMVKCECVEEYKKYTKSAHEKTKKHKTKMMKVDKEKKEILKSVEEKTKNILESLESLEKIKEKLKSYQK